MEQKGDWGEQFSFNISVDALRHILDKTLQSWGRTAYDYSVFQPLAVAGLVLIEVEARRLVEVEVRQSNYPRSVSDNDRCRAAWMIVKKVIDGLKPQDVPKSARDALDRWPSQQWPKDLWIPPEAFGFIVLAGAYVWKWGPNKQIARLLGVGERSVASIRAAAIAEVALRIYSAELRQRGTSSHGDAA